MEAALRVLEADAVLAFGRALVTLSHFGARGLAADDGGKALENPPVGAIGGEHPCDFDTTILVTIGPPVSRPSAIASTTQAMARSAFTRSSALRADGSQRSRAPGVVPGSAAR